MQHISVKLVRSRLRKRPLQMTFSAEDGAEKTGTARYSEPCPRRFCIIRRLQVHGPQTVSLRRPCELLPGGAQHRSLQMLRMTGKTKGPLFQLKAVLFLSSHHLTIDVSETGILSMVP